MPNILLLFLVPFISALIVLLYPSKNKKLLKVFSTSLSVIPLFVLLYIHAEWIATGNEQFVKYEWFKLINIEFYLAIDPLSLLFVYLACIIVPMSLLSARRELIHNTNTFYALVLLLQGLLIGFFTSRDLAFFTFFWEAMLIPLYFIINEWGGPHRHRAALTFLLYMILGSALMVIAVLALYFASANNGSMGTFNLDELQGVAGAMPYAAWMCAAFLLAFAVKTPLFPFHAWLPDAYFQATTPGTILLSGILSKAGIYGVLRITLALFPAIMAEFSPWLLSLAIAGVLYGAFAAWKQNDFKKVLAYSSFSHVNFVLVGLFLMNETAQAGGILQALNHGITITALFLVASWLEQRIGFTNLGRLSGLSLYFPMLCWLTLFFVLSNVALPGLNNFVGEFLIFYGLFAYSPWLTALLGISIILSVVYMLHWMHSIYFNDPSPPHGIWSDIKAKQLLIALPLVILILWVGIYPTPILDHIKPAVNKLVAYNQVEQP